MTFATTDTSAEGPAAQPSAAQITRASFRGWRVLALLTVISAVSVIDRQIISILAPDIKQDLGIGDSEIGLIYGTVFSVFYALFAIPLGTLADGWIRTRQIAGSLAVWSLATIASGLSNGFGQLATWRSVVAIGEAGAGPASNSLVADLFPQSQRGTAYALLTSSVTLGLGLSTLFGGLIVAWWNLRFPTGIGWFGLSAWRATFIAAAIPGLVLTIVILLVREPQRGAADGKVSAPIERPVRRAVSSILPLLPVVNLLGARSAFDLLRRLKWLALAIAAVVAITAALNALPESRPQLVYTTILHIDVTAHAIQALVLCIGVYAAVCWMLDQRRRDPDAFVFMWSRRAFPCLVLISSSQVCIAYGFNAFAAPFALQKFTDGPAAVGQYVGLATVLGGISGTIAGGMFGDWAGQRSRFGRSLVMFLSIAGQIPLGLIALSQQDLAHFVGWYALYLFISAAWYPCCIANVADVMPPPLRGRAYAVLYMAFTILGLGIGPYAVGVMSDATGSLQFAMSAIFFVAPLALAGIVFSLWGQQKGREIISVADGL